MKKEGTTETQEIDTEYSLGKFGDTEYVRQMKKEFYKYGKKLRKIEKYEGMKKEGKPLNKEMTDLLEKKDKFTNYLQTMKKALDIYSKSLKEPEAPQAPAKDPKAEIQEKVKEFVAAATKRLGYFFAVGATLADKDKVSPNPLAKLTPAQQSELINLFKSIVHIPEEKDTSLAEEANHSATLLAQLLQKEAEVATSIAPLIDQIINDSAMTSTHFKLVVPKPVQHPKEYTVNQTISIGKDAVPEPKKEVAPPAFTAENVAAAKEEAKLKEQAAALKEKEAAEVKKPAAKEETGTWAEAEEEPSDEEEKATKAPVVTPQPAPTYAREEYEVAQEVEEPKEADFEYATDKGEERKKRMAERARFPGRRGRYPRRGEGRGEFRGRGQSRGAPRGERRGPRAPRQ